MTSSNDLQESPYDLITDDLVKDAVNKDLGQDAKLLSWKSQDFTKKGDNYSTFVTCVIAKIDIRGKITEKSYVAKLNPLRPKNEISDEMKAMYNRETLVLSEIIVGMTEKLNMLGLPPIRAPKTYSSCSEERKEALIIEDMRKKRFKMFDRTKGMDLEHGLLVVEELGRFHASGLLYEESLPNKSLQDSFEKFKDQWLYPSNPMSKILTAVIIGHCENARQLLESIPKYEKCFKWLTKNMSKTGEFFLQALVPSPPIDVLCHGDCWSNNLLFRYDESGKPVEICLLDFQFVKKASPACDLNSFFYSSFDGNTRNEIMDQLTFSYYLSFTKVFSIAGREPPFTFKDLKKEIHKKMLFGMLSGLLYLPVVLADESEVLDVGKVNAGHIEDFVKDQKASFSSIIHKKIFKSRYLAIFDDMLEAKIFDD